jgi:hypothetical protein
LRHQFYDAIRGIADDDGHLFYRRRTPVLLGQLREDPA